MQAVLTVAGGIVGGMFGMPNLGAMLGSMIGGLLFAEKMPDQYGPKLTDLKVTTSSYGVMIPEVFGQARLSGNIIWSTEKIAKETNHTQGGKGGAPEQNYIETTYSQSLGVLICEGVLKNVLQIIINGKTIYNVSNTATLETHIASSVKADAIRVYRGTADQLPDPTIESIAGIENTSAYRNSAYIVFDNLQLAEFGNNIQNIEFVVTKEGTNITTQDSVFYSQDNVPYFQFCINNPNNTIAYYANPQNNWGNGNIIQVFKMMLNGEKAKIGSFGAPDINNLVPAVSWQSDDNSMLITDNSNKFYLYNTNGYEDISPYILDENGLINGFTSVQNITYLRKNNLILISVQSTDYPNNKTYYYLLNFNNGVNKKATPIQNLLGSVTFNGCLKATITDNYIYATETTSTGLSLFKYDLNLNLISTVVSYSFAQQNSGFQILSIYGVSDNEVYLAIKDTVNKKIYEISSGIFNQKIDLGSDYLFFSNMLYFDGSNYYGNGYSQGQYQYSIKILRNTTKANDVDLTSVINSLFLKSGQSLSLIDTSLLTHKVHGYLLARKSTIRANLEPLLQANFIDVVESGGKLKFVPRGGSVAATIQSSELAVHSYGSESPDNLTIEKKLDFDLPAILNISYLDLNGSFQINTQVAKRKTTNSQNNKTLELPLVLTANEAKQIADVLLTDVWQSRNQVTFTISSKYSYLEPTDIIKVYKNSDLYTLRIIEITSQNNILSVTAVTEDITKYTQESVGSSIPALVDSVSLVLPTNLELLDIPLLRDIDDKQGIYIASNGFIGNYSGCSLLSSSDYGKSYSSLKKFTNKATIGLTTTILGNFSSGNIFDELNAVTVKSHQTLTSTDQISVLNGANVALIGNEIIQFKNAVLTSVNTYVLSGFIRGKQGTEQYISTHAIGERFILLNQTTLDMLSLSSNDYDINKYFNIVTFGDKEANGILKQFTYKGVAQECYSPVNLGGGRDSDGNLTLNWIRRSRLNNSWNNKIDVPLGEDAEAYEVDIINISNGLVVRTLTSNTNTVNYSSAQQVLDFGSNQSSIKFTVYQLSTLRGRGFPATNTI